MESEGMPEEQPTPQPTPNPAEFKVALANGEKSGDKDKDALSGSGWIRDAAAVITLLGAIAGIGVSIWGLVAKARADHETAETNLLIAQQKAGSDKQAADATIEIARQQIDAHKQEYTFLADQHNKDQEQLKSQYEREQASKDEQQLASAVNALFSDSTGGSEGKVDLLSTFIRKDHVNDGLIGDAIAAKLATTTSPSEVAIAFNVLAKLHYNKVPSLVSINENARRQYDAALEQRFWLELRNKARQSQQKVSFLRIRQ
jgi:hypothetical protein